MRKRRISDETAAVLQLFLSAPAQPRYGREIVALAGLKSGSLYPMLRRLEEREVLQSKWEDLEKAVDAGRRPRRLYWLRGDRTEEALEMLSDWQKAQRKSRRPVLGWELPA